MKSRDAVYKRRADDREIRHANHLLVAFLDERHPGEARRIAGPLESDLREESGIDFVDYLEMPRKELFEEADRPLFERFRHERVVRVGERAGRNVPRLVPFEVLFVEKNPHEFRNRNRRMRIVQLNRDAFREEFPVAVVELLEAADNVLERRRAEEVLLLQAEDLSVHRRVVRVEDLRNRFGKFHVLDRGQIVAVVKVGEPEFIRGLGAPKAQVVHRVVAVSRNGRIVGERKNVILCFPAVAELALFVGPGDHIAAERNLDGICRTGDFPRIREAEPVVGKLFLLAVLDLLVEHAIFIADAHARRREFERRHRIEEARGETSEASVAKSRIDFFFAELFERHAQFGNGIFHRLFHVQVQDGVSERPSDQKFERQVIDAFHVLVVVGFLCPNPAIDETVADGIRHGEELFMTRHRVFVTGKRVVNVVVKGLLEGLDGIFQNVGMRLGLFFFRSHFATLSG